MRGRAIYFYNLKEDFVENIKLVEEKLGGLQYVELKHYETPEIKIYTSISELPNIGEIKPISQLYYIALSSEKFFFRKIDLIKGGYSYYPEDENGILKFEPSGIYEGTNCIIKGELSTVAETESRQMLFKELKKAMLKSMMTVSKGNRYYVGKTVIENKEKYRLPYGGIESNPDWDCDISELVWTKKRK